MNMFSSKSNKSSFINIGGQNYNQGLKNKNQNNSLSGRSVKKVSDSSGRRPVPFGVDVLFRSKKNEIDIKPKRDSSENMESSRGGCGVQQIFHDKASIEFRRRGNGEQVPSVFVWNGERTSILARLSLEDVNEIGARGYGVQRGVFSSFRDKKLCVDETVDLGLEARLEDAKLYLKLVEGIRAQFWTSGSHTEKADVDTIVQKRGDGIETTLYLARPGSAPGPSDAPAASPSIYRDKDGRERIFDQHQVGGSPLLVEWPEQKSPFDKGLVLLGSSKNGEQIFTDGRGTVSIYRRVLANGLWRYNKVGGRAATAEEGKAIIDEDLLLRNLYNEVRSGRILALAPISSNAYGKAINLYFDTKTKKVFLVSPESGKGLSYGIPPADLAAAGDIGFGPLFSDKTLTIGGETLRLLRGTPDKDEVCIFAGASGRRRVFDCRRVDGSVFYIEWPSSPNPLDKGLVQLGSSNNGEVRYWNPDNKNVSVYNRERLDGAWSYKEGGSRAATDEEKRLIAEGNSLAGALNDEGGCQDLLNLGHVKAGTKDGNFTLYVNKKTQKFLLVSANGELKSLDFPAVDVTLESQIQFGKDQTGENRYFIWRKKGSEFIRFEDKEGTLEPALCAKRVYNPFAERSAQDGPVDLETYTVGTDDARREFLVPTDTGSVPLYHRVQGRRPNSLVVRSVDGDRTVFLNTATGEVLGEVKGELPSFAESETKAVCTDAAGQFHLVNVMPDQQGGGQQSGRRHDGFLLNGFTKRDCGTLPYVYKMEDGSYVFKKAIRLTTTQLNAPVEEELSNSLDMEQNRGKRSNTRSSSRPSTDGLSGEIQSETSSGGLHTAVSARWGVSAYFWYVISRMKGFFSAPPRQRKDGKVV